MLLLLPLLLLLLLLSLLLLPLKNVPLENWKIGTIRGSGGRCRGLVACDGP